MTIQAEIEAQLQLILEASIAGLIVHTGPISTPQLVEGAERVAAVRMVEGTGNRLEHGQTEWTEAYLVSVWWSESIERADVQTEWKAFTDQLQGDAQLGDAITGLTDAWLNSVAWSEAHEAHHRLVSASVTVARFE